MRRPWIAALIGYTAAALGMTWPLAADIGSRLPYDLGDPLLNCWILAWQIRQFTRLVQGDLSVLGQWWHGNIFHPAPYTLGLSEVMVVPALMGWPVLALTGNLILTYNLLFVATFALSGLFMFLLARELTGTATAAWVAGLLFAFAPYRFEHGSHLQALFACWMPLVLLQVERLARSGRWRHAWGAGMALAALNLSNGYYMFFFAPWVAIYGVVALWRHGLLRERRRWLQLALAAAVALVVTMPAMIPYIALRMAGQSGRTLDWIDRYSASPANWITATPWLRLWGGWLTFVPRTENHLFPGAMPIACLLAALVAWRGFTGLERRLLLFLGLACLAGVWWSLGTNVTIGSWSLPSLYLALYHLVPGFDALRVPSRIAVVVSLWTSVVAAIVITAALRWRWSGNRPAAAVVVALVSTAVLVDAAVVPMRMHDVLHAPHYRQQSPDIPAVPATDPLARLISRLPRTAVLVELPFGALPLEVRYMFASAGHWRRMVNGYSGEFPADYLRWKRDLERLPDGGADAVRALRESGATHVVIHGEHFGPERAEKLQRWLHGLGARPLGRVGEQVVLVLPGTD